ncbi:MAG: toprim domain-containing protein [Candidatus Thorarchaeota archaeon]|jgi:5S rRNA maturation endonuclease (ribonuclease M5)
MSVRRDPYLRDNERTLIELLQSLNNDSESVLIVVEGKRDETVLRRLGVKASIVRTQTRKNRNELIEEIAKRANWGKRVLILTDFDQEGIEIHDYIRSELELRRVPILRRMRRQIRKSMEHWRCIEELVVLFKRVDAPEPK